MEKHNTDAREESASEVLRERVVAFGERAERAEGQKDAGDVQDAAVPGISGTAPSSKRPFSRKVLAAAVAVACVVACAVGVAVAWNGGLFQTVDDAPLKAEQTASDDVAERSSTAVSTSHESSSATEGDERSSSSEAAESTSQESAETQATKANQASAIDIPQGGGPAENTVDASREQASPSASSEGEAAAPSAPAEPVPGSEPEAAPPATPSEEEPVAQTVSVAVDGTVVGAGVFFDDKITYREGMTAYDALVETGVSYNATTSAFGMYVTAIAGLAEKDHGPQSGWKYSVNGAVPQTSASSYVLQPGDVVRWFYATAA